MTKEVVISDVQSGSIAEEVGITVGDILISINDTEIKDIIEYRYIICEEELTVLIKKPNGEEWEIEIEKDYYEDIGLDFEDPIIDHARRCHNKCIFCFIDQLPKNLRESLYFKDDDSRLSFLQGNFVTLTNMKEEDIERIIKYRISPINISVHTTNPELRRLMLNNKNAGLIMERLKRLSDNGIEMNCQIVLCPGINDGLELKRTIVDLYGLYPNVRNVAVVPVGVTRYRENLHKMQTFTEKTASEAIDMIEKIQNGIVKEIGEPFVRFADEFYVLAKRDLPNEHHYGDFDQLEDGIGMIRYLDLRVSEDIEEIKVDGKGTEIGFVTGESAYNYVREAADKIEDSLNVKINVHMIENNFFGGKITVAGLIVGCDIISYFKDKKVEDYIVLPSNMLKADEDVFLDDTTLEELREKLGVKIIKCKYTGDDLVEKIIDEVITCQSQ